MTTTSYPETLAIGETFTTPTWRVHRFATTVRVTHLLNAGRHGKRCDEFAVWLWRHTYDLAGIALRLACLAVDGIGPDEMAVEIEVASRECGGESDRIARKGVDVAPAGIETFRINGANVRVIAEYKDWSVLDTVDTNNEPTLIPLKNKDRKAFYAWAKKNEEALKTMHFNDVMRALREAGIGYHYYCAVD